MVARSGNFRDRHPSAKTAIKALVTTCLVTGGANLPKETLGQNTGQGNIHHLLLDAHFQEPRPGFVGHAAVQTGEDEMTCHGGTNRDPSRFDITDLAHHDDLRILPQKILEAESEIHLTGRINLNLGTAINISLNGIFD